MVFISFISRCILFLLIICPNTLIFLFANFYFLLLTLIFTLSKHLNTFYISTKCCSIFDLNIVILSIYITTYLYYKSIKILAIIFEKLYLIILFSLAKLYIKKVLKEIQTQLIPLNFYTVLFGFFFKSNIKKLYF